MKTISIFLLICCISAAEAIDIVKAGKARADIAIPEKTVLSVEFAAKELQKHIKLISGAELPIVKADAPRRYPNRIHLGYGAAPKDKSAFAWRVKAGKNDLYLHGNDKKLSADKKNDFFKAVNGWWIVSSGTLMAVYDFLDRELKVRWYRPSDEGIWAEKTKNICIAPFDRQDKPKLTSARFTHITQHDIKKRWKNKKAGYEYITEERIWMLRHRIVNCDWFNTGHSFTTYWKRFGKKHPEYFAKLHDGTRRPLKGDPTGKYIAMCVSSPELLKRIVSDARRGYGPDGRFKLKNHIALGENDSPGMCTCDGCRAWDMPEFDPDASSYWRDKPVLTSSTRFSGFGVDEGGTYNYEKTSLSDRYAKFWLTVQKEISKFKPGIIVYGYAYSNTTLPPKHAKLNKNILVSYVGYPYYPLVPERRNKFWKEWDGWMKTGCTMIFRPNTLLSGGAYPLQYGERFAKDYRKLLTQYPRMVRIDISALRGEYANMGPMWYLLTRLTYRSDLTVKQITDEYFKCFGSIEAELRAYFAYWTKISNAVTQKQVTQWEKELGYKFMVWNNNDMCVKIFNTKQFAEAKKILDKAEKAAKTPREKKIVKFFQLGLEHARLTWHGGNAHLKRVLDNTPANQENWKRKRAAVLKFREKHEGAWFSDIRYTTHRESYGYRHSKPRKKKITER